MHEGETKGKAGRLSMNMNYVVICRQDRQPNGEPGNIVLASRTLFDAERAAAYVRSILSSREPRIITIREYLTEIEGWRVVEGIVAVIELKQHLAECERQFQAKVTEITVLLDRALKAEAERDLAVRDLGQISADYLKAEAALRQIREQYLKWQASNAEDDDHIALHRIDKIASAALAQDKTP